MEVEGPARAGRLVVAGREGLKEAEAGEGDLVDHGVDTAGDGQVEVAPADDVEGVPDGLARGAG